MGLVVHDLLVLVLTLSSVALRVVLANVLLDVAGDLRSDVLVVSVVLLLVAEVVQGQDRARQPVVAVERKTERKRARARRILVVSLPSLTHMMG